jgi:hypothetical protein
VRVARLGLRQPVLLGDQSAAEVVAGLGVEGPEEVAEVHETTYDGGAVSQ